MKRNPILDFEIDQASIRCIGHDLQRPECILAEPDGTLWSADARGGVARLTPDGGQDIVTQQRSAHFQAAGTEATRYLEGTLPNGLARSQWRFSHFELRHRLPGTDVVRWNLESAGRQDRRSTCRESEFRAPGFERPDLDHSLNQSQELETTGGYITRLRIDAAGNVAEREAFGPRSFGKGAWPDGIAFDSYGNLWGTMVYSDKLFVLTP